MSDAAHLIGCLADEMLTRIDEADAKRRIA